jgi:hypothetical protein
MSDLPDVTAWCRSDLSDVIRGFIRERGGVPVTALEADELADRLCNRIGLEVHMHLDRQAWLFRNAPAPPYRPDRTLGPDGATAAFDDVPF